MLFKEKTVSTVFNYFLGSAGEISLPTYSKIQRKKQPNDEAYIPAFPLTVVYVEQGSQIKLIYLKGEASIFIFNVDLIQQSIFLNRKVKVELC